VDDLKTIVAYHQQVLQSIENQLGQVVENLDRFERSMEGAERQREGDRREANRRMSHTEIYLQRAFRMGVAAMRRERKARLEADQRLEEQRGADRREWQERHSRIERLLEQSIRGRNRSGAESTATW